MRRESSLVMQGFAICNTRLGGFFIYAVLSVDERGNDKFFCVVQDGETNTHNIRFATQCAFFSKKYNGNLLYILCLFYVFCTVNLCYIYICIIRKYFVETKKNIDKS